MVRGVIIAGAIAIGGLTFGAGGVSALPASSGPSSKALPEMSLIEKTQYRYCRRWYRECRERWGGGRDFRRCMRRHGCDS
jgi:hypothetical protein